MAVKFTVALPEDIIGKARVTITQGKLDEDFFYSKTEETFDLQSTMLEYYSDVSFHIKIEFEIENIPSVVRTDVFCTDIQEHTNDSGDIGIIEYSYIDKSNILMVIRETKDVDTDRHKTVRFGIIKYNIEDNTYEIVAQKAFDLSINGVMPIYPHKQVTTDGIVNYWGVADRIDSNSLSAATTPVICRVDTSTNEITGMSTYYGAVNPPKNSDDMLNDYVFVAETTKKTVGVFRLNGAPGNVSGYEMAFNSVVPVNVDHYCVKTSDGKYVFPFTAHQQDALYVAIYDPDTSTFAVKKITPASSGAFYNSSNGGLIRIIDLEYYIEDGKDKILLALIQSTGTPSVDIKVISFLELEYSGGNIAVSPKQSIIVLTDPDMKFAKYAPGSLIGPHDGYFYFAYTVEYDDAYGLFIAKLDTTLSVVASAFYKTAVLYRSYPYLKYEGGKLRLIVSSYYTYVGGTSAKIGTQILTLDPETLKPTDIPPTLVVTNVVAFDNSDYILTGSGSTVEDETGYVTSAKSFTLGSMTTITSDLTIYVCSNYNYDTLSTVVGPYVYAYYYYYYYYYYYGG